MQQYKGQSGDKVKGLFVGLSAQQALPVGLVNQTYGFLCPPLAGGAKSAISRRGQKRLSDNKAIRQYVNKEILNSDNSCEPKRLPFQNGMSNLKFFNPSTCQPFNFTAPLSRLRHSRHKAYRAQGIQGTSFAGLSGSLCIPQW